MTRTLKLFVCIGIITSCFIADAVSEGNANTDTASVDTTESTGWINYLGLNVPSKISEASKSASDASIAAKKVLEDYKENGIKVNKDVLDAVKAGVSVNINLATTAEINTTVAGLRTDLNNSLLMKKNAQSATKTIAFSTFGFVVSCIGAKILYDSCKNIADKLNDPENEELSWHEVLSTGDYLYVAAGVGTIGCGLTVIAKSDSLAQ